jgi:predicted HAD superfamily Cof-like phosphohydrolase
MRDRSDYCTRTITRGLEAIEDAVTDFHEAFGLAVGRKDKPGFDAEQTALRLKLLKEEVDELELAQYGKRPLIDATDAYADIIYLAIGGLVQMGVEVGPVLEEVHRSNMSKLGLDGRPIYRADGKVAKGPNYEPPDIAGVLDAQTDYYNLPRHPSEDEWSEGETLF